MTQEESRCVVTERPGRRDAHAVLVAAAGFVKLPAPHHGVTFRLAVVGRVGVQLHAHRVRVEAPEVYLDGDTPLRAMS